MKKVTVMKTTLIILLLCLMRINAQNEDEIVNQNNSNNRVIFLSIGTGFPECLTSRIGYQLNNNWSLSCKASVYYSNTGGTMNFGVGVLGIKVTNYFDEKIFVFNNLSFDAGYLRAAGDKNLAFDLSVGNESILKSVRTYWALGFSIVQEGSSEHVYLLPGIKLGINLNL